MLNNEEIAELKLEVASSVRGLGFATTTIVMTAVELAVRKHLGVSTTMVRRQELEQMYSEVQVLKGVLADRDAEIAELRKRLGVRDSKAKPAPSEKVRASKKATDGLGG